jgi:hypothetical protein
MGRRADPRSNIEHRIGSREADPASKTNIRLSGFIQHPDAALISVICGSAVNR